MTPSPAGALSLKRFFGAMRPFLSGERDVGWVEETIGRYPSGTARLDLYRRLVRGNHTRILDKLYPVTKSCLPRATWGRLQAAYLAQHPPRHWELNRAGAALSAWLLERVASGDDRELPDWLPELADFEWLDFATYTHPAAAPEDDLALNPTLDARELRYDIARWVGQPASERDEAPARRDHVLLAYRDPETLQCRFLEAGPLTLFVVQALRQGFDPAQAATDHGISADAVATERQQLTDQGVIVASR